MGLAASQGRLLLLTARKSDLEYRAQEISQRRLLLATELEAVATKYARKTGNRQMKLTTQVVQSETNATREVNLTYQALMQHGLTTDGDSNLANSIYRIKNSNGEIVAASQTELGNRKTSLEAQGYVISGATGSSFTATKDGVSQKYVVDSRINDASTTENYFQEGLRNGRFIIEQRTTIDDDTTNGEWAAQGWSGMTEIQDNAYTDDDAYAQAEYQAATARVKALDKKLETDQKQIETQHKAVETELESVKKVIQNNVDGSFKMFS